MCKIILSAAAALRPSPDQQTTRRAIFIIRFFSQQSDYLHGRSNGTERGNGAEESEAERYPGRSIGFRPESAPTVLDMSPEGSLSGPPSVRNMDLNEMSHRGT